MKRFYFEITQANIMECVWAESFTEAKQKAAEDWLPFWDQIKWIKPEESPEQSTLPVIFDE